MRKQQESKINKVVNVLLILLLSLVIIQTIHLTYAQSTGSSSNPWALSLNLENSQNVASTTFAPFDQVQLNATVTYANASQPDVLVYFNVTGPSNSANPTSITRIETTNPSGEAGFLFRLPTIGQNGTSPIGMWQATATIQTISGPMKQSVVFTTQWSMVISSINLVNSQGQNQTVFSPGDNVTAQAGIVNQGQTQAANVVFYIIGPNGQIISQTQITNNTIPSSNSTEVQSSLQIPSNASTGQASFNVAAYGANYNSTYIPIAQPAGVYFTISTNSTTTPTASPTPNPHPTPPPFLENSVSLFSWLLVATGLFTFTLLYMFLKRKPMNMGPQMPTMPVIKAGGAVAATQSTLDQQPTTPTMPTNVSAPISTQATMATVPIIFEQGQSQPNTNTEQANNPSEETSTTQNPSTAIAEHLRKISEQGKRIQDIESTLELEKQQLAKEVAALNKIVEDQEKAMMSYFNSIKQTIADLTPNAKNKPPTDTTAQQKNDDQQPKENEN